ncbi:MAG: aromatic-L-amino-acid decarboxylase, partial [Myxococcota bacterium]
MNAATFRTLGHRLVDWVADYWDRVESLPVRSPLAPGQVAARLPAAAPEAPDDWEAILADLDEVVVPGLTHWQHPSFFAYYPANVSGPSVLGELVSAGLGAQGMLWQTSPAMTEVETRVLDWMADLLGLSAEFRSDAPTGGGVIQGTASEATLVSLLAARARAGGPVAELCVYTSSQAHSSVVKAAMVAGLAQGPDDRRQVRLIPVDDALQMRPDALTAAIRADRAAGMTPAWVCATVGTTGTAAVDPVPAIADVIEAEAPQAWLHVDSAYAGVLGLCPEHRHLLAGVERADSLVVNAHKWLLTNFDCSLFWTRDRPAVLDALSITPDYLRNAASDSGSVIDYRDWQVPLGRRFRALKLWFVLRHYGAEGLRRYLRAHVELARSFEAKVRSDPRFICVGDRHAALVCFRLGSGDGPTRALLGA